MILLIVVIIMRVRMIIVIWDTGKCYHVRHSCDDGNECTIDTCNPLNADTPCSYSPRM
jgi:hypothetical protein